MTSKRRLLTAMQGGEPDLVPNAPALGAWLTGRTGGAEWPDYVRLKREFDYDPLACVAPKLNDYLASATGPYTDLPEVTVELEQERHGGTTLIHRVIHTPAGDLTSVLREADPGQVYGMTPDPYRVEYPMKTQEDFEKIQYLMPDPEDPAAYAHVQDVIRAAGEEALIEWLAPYSPDSCITNALGHNRAMMLWADDPAFFVGALHYFHDLHLKTIRMLCEAGAEVIMNGWFQGGLGAGWSPEMYREVIQPMVKADADLVHRYGRLYHVYDDGKCNAVLEDLAEAGVDCLGTLTPPPVGDVDLADAKRRVGKRVCLKGNIDLYHVLMRGTPELVRQKVREAIEAAASGGGYILSTSDSVREGTAIENLRAYFDAGREFGQTG